MLQLTGGIGAELAIDAAGFKATCEDAVWSARRGGRMVQVGLPLGGEPPVVPMARVAGREIEIIGAPAWSEPPSWLRQSWPLTARGALAFGSRAGRHVCA